MASASAWIKTLFGTPDFAAWLQAFAAVVALFISAWAVLRTGRAERRRDRMEKSGIAVAIYPEILELEIVIGNVQARLRTVVEAHAGKLVGQSIAWTIQQIAHISTPPFLDRYTDRLFMLGELAGASCLQLVSGLLRYNTFVEDVAARVVTMSAGQWAETVGHLEDHLDFLGAVIAKCKHEIQPIHDAIRG